MPVVVEQVVKRSLSVQSIDCHEHHQPCWLLVVLTLLSRRTSSRNYAEGTARVLLLFVCNMDALASCTLLSFHGKKNDKEVSSAHKDKELKNMSIEDNKIEEAGSQQI